MSRPRWRVILLRAVVREQVASAPAPHPPAGPCTIGDGAMSELHQGQLWRWSMASFDSNGVGRRSDAVLQVDRHRDQQELVALVLGTVCGQVVQNKLLAERQPQHR